MSQQVASLLYIPGPRSRSRRLARLVDAYYKVHSHLPGSPSMPLDLQNVLAVVQLPCTTEHTDEASCPDCTRLLSELIAAIRAQPALVIWPIITEVINQVEAFDDESTATTPRVQAVPVSAESPTRRAIALLSNLAGYRATLHSPCQRCGSLLWYERAGRFHCFLCTPPARFPETLAASIRETCAV